MLAVMGSDALVALDIGNQEHVPRACVPQLACVQVYGRHSSI